MMDKRVTEEKFSDHELTIRACPQCGTSWFSIRGEYSRPPWQIVECTSCRFVYLRNPPSYRRLADEFAWEKTRREEFARRKAHSPVRVSIDHATRWRTKMFSTEISTELHHLFPFGRVLDVGCGAGKKVPEPYTPFGIEISEALFHAADEHMRARGGRAIHASGLEGIKEFDDGYFSGIVLRSYLEHEVLPKDLLRECIRVLGEDGSIYVRVPNYGSINRRVLGFKWCGFRSPDHVNYFTVSSLASMARDCGLDLTLLHPYRLPFDDNINGILRPLLNRASGSHPLPSSV